jgi:UDP-N-acetylglucosamine 2-epimerase (non-hydrolysing)
MVYNDNRLIRNGALGFGKHVVKLGTTERPEAVEAGTVKFIGTDYDKIVGETFALLDNKDCYDALGKFVNPYGDGKACERISSLLNGC